ncbi:LIM domain-binding protein 3-like isoform X2 [Paramormyrops kingsleyae]|uniref:LIM domain-binding protein 3-like isoform X2 n=1 Tax=Paramormyrops kingsleyae TaxID=1676925 RepID=UPI003B977B1C
MSTYTVNLSGPAPWGFRLQGGKDFNMPLTISRITPGSKASQGSLTQGDVIVAIDGVSTEGMTHLEAQNKIKCAGYNLALTMQRPKRPIPMPIAPPRMDTCIPIIPPQKVMNTTINNEYASSFNPSMLKDSTLSTHKPIEVKGPGGKATIIHAQYNTPISMYSQDAIMDAIAGQSQARGSDLSSSDIPVANPPFVILPVREPLVDSTSPVYQAVLQAENRDTDAAERSRRSTHPQSKCFRILAHMTGTELEQDEYEELPRRSSTPVEHAAVSTSPTPASLPVAASTNQPVPETKSLTHQVPASPPIAQTAVAAPVASTPESLPAPPSSRPAALLGPCHLSLAASTISSALSAQSRNYVSKPGLPPSSALEALPITPIFRSRNLPKRTRPLPMGKPQLSSFTTQPTIGYSSQFTSSPPRPYGKAPPIQQSSIQIPVGPPSPKVVSTANILPTAYPTAPAPVPTPVHISVAPPVASTPPDSNRPPWITDNTFAQKFEPNKTTTTTTNIKVQPLPQSAPPPPAYIPNPGQTPPVPSPVTAPIPFPPVARGVAQRAERFAASGRTPLCAACNNIIRGPFLVALGRSWHPEEFNCHYCHTSLADVSFVEEQNNVYCESCYGEFFAPTCARCSTKIMGEVMHALRQTWHTNCFVCAACGKPFGNSLFHMEDGEPYCEKDYVVLFSTKCHGCDFPVEAGDKFIEALGHTWHDTCFVCAVCHINLEGQPFYSKKDKPLCKKHAHAINV